MSSLKNVEKFDVTTAVPVKQNWLQRNLNKLTFGSMATLLFTSNANAALPQIDTTELLGFVAVVIAAVATVGASVLMIYMTARGIKAIRAVF